MGLFPFWHEIELIFNNSVIQLPNALLRTLIDRGTEYNGHKESHAYELYLNLEDIEHTNTNVYSTQTNGIYEQFHKAMKTECYVILFRRKIYTQLSEIQNDIEQWPAFYNPHSGK
ncbi:integrase core domain-containing protein [Candidatus Schmidhempelia bombi]|uniref:Integrase catalytic domain-containing protein n=1 Tax=Candidatus Schmidhempelia bombi str. Bimp TaxID=1387197 RepID=A0AB94IA86_9GAMM|nr:hypothetical protein O970_09515 [Candidatus Schmidhempelia bombi str. Bimp]